MKCLAIIPARSGSKGLKNKNIKLLNGRPLIHYTIDAAKKANIFDEIMVSTDSIKYARIAKKLDGVSIPFLRSKNNSEDNSSSWSMVKEVLQKYKENGMEFDAFCLLQPTSPLRSSQHIVEAYDMFVSKKANSIVSVCELGCPINICNILPKNLSLQKFITSKNKYLRQDNPVYYRLNGAIYMCKVKYFLKYNDIYRCKSYAYIMPTINSIDIDTQEDFDLVAKIIK